MFTRLSFKLLTLSLLVLPLAAGAQFGKIDNFFVNLTNFINNVIVPFVFVIAFVIFIIGVLRYFILNGDDEDKRKEGQNLMLYGIIGFVVMVTIWGIVNLLAGGLGEGLGEDTRALDAGSIPVVPGDRG